MSISSRIHDTIEGWVIEWRDRLRGWMSSWVENGLERLMDAMEPELRAEIKPSLLRLRDIPGMPDDVKSLIDKTVAEPGFIHLAAVLPYLIGIMIGFGMGAAAPAARLGSYQVDKLVSSYRLDPMAAITAWRRDPETYAHLFDDLKDQGWSEERVEALKFYTLFYPAPADLIRWQAREVFEPEMIERYGLDSEFGAIEKEPFYKAGMTDEQILNYWRAHWEHASWMQVVEMLHRGLLTESEVWDWFRVVEIPPFWRQHLIDTAYTWPTRVDVRRWWDMRTIDETELRRLYSGMGYRGVNLDNYVIWTKVYVAFPDLMARWTKGWITIDDVRRELTGLGMPAARVEEMIQMKIKPSEPERVEEGRALTKTEIYKGVKKELITWSEGIELLMDLGYGYDEADYILAVNVGALEGSPGTYEEFKDLTTKYKIATGREAKPMSEELKKAAGEVVRITGEVEALNLAIKEEKAELIEGEELPEAATARLTELQVTRNRAESELMRAKIEYDRLIAEWRHGLP